MYSSEYIVSGNNHINADKLMIVAHPDDEVLFGGRELLSEKGWKVICVTNATLKSNNRLVFNKINFRKSEFISVMNALGCQYEMWDFEDNGFNANWDEILFTKQLLRVINERPYKKIVTHNLDGEYGHIQHKKVSQLVHNFNPKNLHVFEYDENDINPYLKEMGNILYLYSSQKEILEKHYKYIVHQSIKIVDYLN